VRELSIQNEQTVQLIGFESVVEIVGAVDSLRRGASTRSVLRTGETPAGEAEQPLRWTSGHGPVSLAQPRLLCLAPRAALREQEDAMTRWLAR
jgi:hypothetical protein